MYHKNRKIIKRKDKKTSGNISKYMIYYQGIIEKKDTDAISDDCPLV